MNSIVNRIVIRVQPRRVQPRRFASFPLGHQETGFDQMGLEHPGEESLGGAHPRSEAPGNGAPGNGVPRSGHAADPISNLPWSTSPGQDQVTTAESTVGEPANSHRPQSPLTGANALDLATDSPLARRSAQLRPAETFAGEAVNKLFWLLCLAALIFGTMQLGPYLVEKYQYAATAGRVKAEYENAVNILKNNPLAGISKAYQLVAQAVKPSVVSIKCIKVASVGRRSQAIIGAGQGSGVVISADGYIVTNAHVIEDSGDILVKLSDRREFPAVVVGTDPLTDVAVLKIKADKLIPARWGDSELLEVGSIVWAIGTPYELEQTVTSGVVSGKNRYEREGDQERVQQELIQTDAAVNPGNSGGPLINTEGLVVGINTSIYGDKFQGISFAVPSQIVRYVTDQLITNGEVRRGFLGFVPHPVSAAQAAVLSLPDFDGARIGQVTPNSPADLAGLRVDDVIRRWNDVKIKDHRDVFRLVATTPPNSKARVEIIREGRPINLEVVTGDRKQLQQSFPPDGFQNPQ
ncbi:MAG: S1C family serine protease [Planctomycetota bacterium]